jgi:asparagine synthetase B (glutamine-hydrolysing)
VRRYGNQPITREEIYILLSSMEHRGSHATGICLVNDGGHDFAVHKLAEPAWSFCKHASTQAFLDEHLRDDTEIALLHTRFATVGDPNKLENNHPIHDGVTAITHNGGISNARELFRSEGLTPVCETDSDIIRAILDKEGFEPKAARTLSKCHGSAAIAAISTAYPGTLVLGRSGNPLVVAEANEKLYWASEMQSIHKALRPFRRGLSGLWLRDKKPETSFHTLPDNTMYLIPAEPVVGNTPIPHFEMKIAYSFRSPIYKSHDTHEEKMRTWKSPEKPDRVFTACIKCGHIQSKHNTAEWSRLVCSNPGCDQDFEYLDAAEKETVTA